MKENNLRIILVAVIFLFILSGITLKPTYAQSSKDQASATTIPPALLKGLDAYVHKVMKQWQVPGMAIAVVKDGKVIMAKGYGVRKLGKPGKVDVNTMFGIGSDSKQFTAGALGTLVGAGKLTWDAPVVKYIKNFKLSSPYVTENITLRDLLTHRSGYCDPLPMWYTSDAATAIERMRYQRPNYGFRAHFCYNNIMFITGAQYIPAITGETYNRYIKEHIFEPLGMTRTVSTTMAVSAASNVAATHAFVNGKMTVIRSYWPHNLDAITSVGGIYSSIVDQSHWLDMMLNDGRYNNKTVLDSDVVRAMETPQKLIEKDSGISGLIRELFPGSHYYAYGLGLIISDYGGHKLVWHLGGLEGMDAAIAMIPDMKLGVAVLANSWAQSSAFVTRYVIEQYLNMPHKDISDTFYANMEKARETFEAEQKKLAANFKPGPPPLPLKSYTGLYKDDLDGSAQVILQKGHLVLRLQNPYFTGDLQHWHGNTFRVTWRYRFYQNWNSVIGPVYATFDLNAYGKPVKVLFNRVPLHYEREGKPGSSGK